jgi:hypothetical protein
MAGYIKLHRAACGYVAPVGGRRWTVDYAKICRPTAASIDEWSVAELGKQPDRCPRCAP